MLTGLVSSQLGEYATTGELPGPPGSRPGLSAPAPVPTPVTPPGGPVRQTARHMDAPATQYALRGRDPYRYQIWGSEPVDALEFNGGLMTSIDEPNWLPSTQRIADFSRLIRFDTGGLAVHIASSAEHAMAGVDEVFVTGTVRVVGSGSPSTKGPDATSRSCPASSRSRPWSGSRPRHL